VHRRIANFVTLALVGGMMLAACSSPHITTAAYNGGNNAPRTKPIPTATSTPSKPTTTTSSTTTTTFPLSKTPGPGPAHPVSDTPKNMDKPGTPEWVAAQYVRAAYSMSFLWPNPYYWIKTATPYISPSYLATLQATLSPTNLAPAEEELWRQVVTYQEGYWVDVTSSLIAVRAPRTPTSCYVNVSHLIGVVKPKGTRLPPSTNVPSTMSYPMVKIGSTWYVNGPAVTAFGT
jgi:hypothetical protein